jgi:hypothetical protein
MNQPDPERGRPDLTIAAVIGCILFGLAFLSGEGLPFAPFIFGLVVGLGWLLDRCALNPEEECRVPSEVETAPRKRFGTSDAPERRQEGIQQRQEALQEGPSPTDLPILPVANHPEAADHSIMVPTRPRRSFEFSSRYHSALLWCLASQGVAGFLVGMTVGLFEVWASISQPVVENPGPRFAEFLVIAVLSQWLVILYILLRRPKSPTKSDLWFIRVGIFPMLLAAPFLAYGVWSVIGHSTESGWERLFSE